MRFLTADERYSIGARLLHCSSAMDASWERGRKFKGLLRRTERGSPSQITKSKPITAPGFSSERNLAGVCATADAHEWTLIRKEEAAKKMGTRNPRMQWLTLMMAMRDTSRNDSRCNSGTEIAL